MAEIPVVVIDVQRPGPVTGLPTRTEQSDLKFVISASQGEFPRMVIALRNCMDAFNQTMRAFYLAEKYQIPVIILSDQYLGDATHTAEEFKPEQNQRVEPVDEYAEEGEYLRYNYTDSGISPRLIPGTSKHLVVIDSDEHAGTNVIDIGQCGTEMIYFATAHLKTDGGIMVTASHNPANYNGMKLVRRGAKPISEDTGLKDIARMVVNGAIPDSIYPGTKVGKIETYNIMPEYVKHILTYVDTAVLKPLKIVVNPGNGGAGAVIKKMEKKLPFEFIKINEKPDGTFPNGVPNPLLPENRAVTSKVVIDKKADLGIAWDGDFDRCFFFDEKGNFIEGYYLVGLLAQVFLEKNPGEKILYDPRLTWNTEEIIEKFKGQPVRCKSGHGQIMMLFVI